MKQKKMKDGKTGTIGITKENGLKKHSEESNVILTASSITPYPNIDEVQSPSIHLIDESTKQLKDLMNAITSNVVEEKNLFSSVNTANAACNCAKQIASLLRVKLDIYKEYKKGISR